MTWHERNELISDMGYLFGWIYGKQSTEFITATWDHYNSFSLNEKNDQD